MVPHPIQQLENTDLVQNGFLLQLLSYKLRGSIRHLSKDTYYTEPVLQPHQPELTGPGLLAQEHNCMEHCSDWRLQNAVNKLLFDPKQLRNKTKEKKNPPNKPKKHRRSLVFIPQFLRLKGKKEVSVIYEMLSGVAKISICF